MRFNPFASGGKSAVEQSVIDDMRGQIAAINKSQAVIEFGLDGTILTANDNFLRALGYPLSDIQGKHHSLFVEPALRDSAAYRAFWDKLGRGEFHAAVYKRIGKGGREVWIQASYNPIFNAAGQPWKVVKYATDITAQTVRAADHEGQIAAIGRSQAVIEFELDGTIRTANANFLNVIGYTLDEIRGRHHSLFVTPEHRDSAEYRAFWAKLGRGEYDVAQYLRIGKDGRKVWIQASYNPIFDPNGKPYKIVKYASDVTQQVVMAQQLKAALDETRNAVQSTIDGDLVVRLPTQGKSGEIEALCRSINALLDATMTVITQVKTAAREVQAGTEEIAQGNSDLAERTIEQASGLEETASSMQQMTSTVKHTADNAKQANQLASNARVQAEKGGAIVESAVSAMSQINASSRRIADIIGVIDEIAFQTNLLALNAAVEAARAGEQGLGFAVVASEVRSLAGRSASAAKEIKNLIQGSVAKVEEGSRLVNDSGRALAEIMDAIKNLNDIVADIAAASAEESQGIEKVGHAVIQMNDVTRKNTVLVEEAAAISRSIVDQAQALNQLVARYHIGEAERRAAPGPAAPTAAPTVRPARWAPARSTGPTASWSGASSEGTLGREAPPVDRP